MNWLYRQTSGGLWLDGRFIVTGYSGHGVGKNNGTMQDVHDIGPIPVGKYTIGPAYAHPQKGPLVMRLNADASNEMFGRSGFLIHGDSAAHPGEASEGCIILPHSIRQEISVSVCRDLIVTP